MTRVLLQFRSVKAGFQGEFGPMRIPKVHYFTHQLIKDFGIPTAPFTSVQSHAFYYVRGVKSPVTAFKTPIGRQRFYDIYDVATNETSRAPSVSKFVTMGDKVYQFFSDISL